MSIPDPHPTPSPTSHAEEIYTFGYSDAALQIMLGRTAENSAGFLLPHLRSGMRVLDCGCGPGTITIDLAQTVTPGEAVGVDLEPSQVELARTRAAERGATNARFEVGNVYNLPFPNETFDAVFGHTIVMQFRDPVSALREVHRVLKPDGVAGFRELAFDGNLYEPPDSAVQQFWELFGRMVQHNGGDVRVGKRLGSLLQQAGFTRITMSASYATYFGTPEQQQAVSEIFARYCEEVAFVDQAIALGWADPDIRSRLSAALRAEATHAACFYAGAFCEVIGWKEAPPAQT